MTALTVVASVALALAMWGVTIAVQGAPRVGALLPAPAWPWATRGTSIGAALGAIATATLVVFGVVTHGWNLQLLPLLLLVAIGLPAAYTDARELRLPNELTYGLAAAATMTVVVLDLGVATGNAARALMGGVGYALLLLLVAILTPAGREAESGTATIAPTALGLGDVKLAAGVGAVLAWTSTAALLMGIALMAVAHLTWSGICSTLRSTRAIHTMNGSALGPWILAGAIVASATLSEWG